MIGMDINKIIKGRRLDRLTSTPKPEPTPQPAPDTELDIDQPEQPLERRGHLESLAEPPREESVCGSGWSLAQLLDEFGR